MKLLGETALVAAAGLVFALAANALSSRGLRLSRNYFPEIKPAPNQVAPIAPGATNSPVQIASATPAAADPLAAVRSRLQQRGLQLIASNEVATLFRDPRYQQGLVVFVDARDDRHYQEGHIPGARQFDHYRAENYLPTVLPACLPAQQVVVYCNGGNCEDSEFAAAILRDAGVPAANLFVYAGGITEWTTNGLPVEIGARGSGQLLPSRP